jgi:hypothetical protein
MALSRNSAATPSNKQFRRLQENDDRVALVEANPPLATVDDFADEIGRLWSDVQHKFLLIGRYLNDAKEKLPHGEFEALIAERLPFSPSIGRQLRTVASRLDQGVLPMARLPANYTTIYQILTLTPDELAQAETENLIRPDVTRREVVTFKNRLRHSPADRTAKEARLKRFLSVQRRLAAKIATLQAELGGHIIDVTATVLADDEDNRR